MAGTVQGTTPGVGHGTVVAARYRLDAPTGPIAPVREWTADDLKDGGRVRLWVCRPGAAAADLLDSARRARGVSLDGVVPVLGAGDDSGVAWVALAIPAGRSLRRLLDGQPLPPESARRIVGEAAKVLARSGARGLHHGRLSPDDVIVDDAGRVVLDGVGLAAARHGLSVSGDEARRADAVGLVRLLHAALTGRWHGPVSLSAGLPQAPRLAGAIVGPADLVGGVPNDLDTLCRVTLGTDVDGPLSPRELAEQLAPWAGVAPVATAGALDATGPSRPVPEEIAVDPRAGAVPAPSTTAPSTTAPSTTAPSTTAPSTTAPSTTAPVDIRTAATEVVDVSGAERSRVAAVGGAVRAGAGTSSSGGAVRSSVADPAAAGVEEIPPSFRPSTSASTLWEWAESPVSAVGSPEGSPVPQLPGVDPLTVAAPDERQSRAVLALMAVLVLVGLLIGAAALRQATRDGLTLFSDDSSVSLPPLASGGGRPSGAPAPSAASPASIMRAQAMDPQGDDEENDDDAPRAVDSSSSTSWRSDRYRSKDFGGLKDGLGLSLQLSSGSVKGVVAKIEGEGGRVELRTAPGPGLDGSVVVATSEIADGTATLVPARPITSGYLVLWFTELPRVDGGYRAEVSDVRVR